MYDELVQAFAKEEGCTEQLKATDQMLWMRKMNNATQRAREVVNAELILQLRIFINKSIENFTYLLVKFSMKKKNERVSRCCLFTRSLSLFRVWYRHQFSCSCMDLRFDCCQAFLGQIDGRMSCECEAQQLAELRFLLTAHYCLTNLVERHTVGRCSCLCIFAEIF